MAAGERAHLAGERAQRVGPVGARARAARSRRERARRSRRAARRGSRRGGRATSPRRRARRRGGASSARRRPRGRAARAPRRRSLAARACGAVRAVARGALGDAAARAGVVLSFMLAPQGARRPRDRHTVRPTRQRKLTGPMSIVMLIVGLLLGAAAASGPAAGPRAHRAAAARGRARRATRAQVELLEASREQLRTEMQGDLGGCASADRGDARAARSRRRARPTPSAPPARWARAPPSCAGSSSRCRRSSARSPSRSSCSSASGARRRAQMGEMFRTLGEGLAGLRAETGNLVGALRRPPTRGAWGEIQLRNVIEMAGHGRALRLRRAVDDRRIGTATPTGRLRPDVLVRLPGGKLIVVDAKVPLDAYLSAIEAATDEERALHLARHARQTRDHIAKLASKGYQSRLDSSPELVVMFVPSEGIYHAALSEDPSLIEYGVEQQVLLATPTTLIGAAPRDPLRLEAGADRGLGARDRRDRARAAQADRALRRAARARRPPARLGGQRLQRGGRLVRVARRSRSCAASRRPAPAPGATSSWPASRRRRAASRRRARSSGGRRGPDRRAARKLDVGAIAATDIRSARSGS